jgi:hypothetical protein
MSGHDDNGGGWGVLAGSTIFLVQIFVLAPGLLPLLLLTAAFTLPLLVLGLPFALVAATYAGIRRVLVR